MQSEVKSDGAVCNCSRVNWHALAVSSTTQLLLEASFFSQLFYFCLRNNMCRVCVVHSSSSWALLTLNFLLVATSYVLRAVKMAGIANAISAGKHRQ